MAVLDKMEAQLRELKPSGISREQRIKTIK